MLNIKKLDSSVVDQIAAGEVIERPAQLVKELIENSLDAQATSIEVQFADGGLYVSVKDNGHGISTEELTLALSRHATSKITNAKDLFSVHTYGFRGEALASISSVSDLTLLSRYKNSGQAYRVKSQFGKTLKVEAVGGTVGTTITVNDLFKNVPARLRFLKSENVEAQAIKNVITAQALSHPQVSFRVIHKNKLLFFWSACSSYMKRAEMILSAPLHDHTYKNDSWSVRVILSPPNKTVSSSKKIWFFVNGRSVQNKILYGAIMSAHRNLLMHGEYPVCALYLSCPYTEVDANVHPTKNQVKFISESRVFQTVQKGVRELLEQAPWLKDLSTPLERPVVKKSVFHKKKSQSSALSSLKKQISFSLLQRKAHAGYPLEGDSDSKTMDKESFHPKEIEIESHLKSPIQEDKSSSEVHQVSKTQDSFVQETSQKIFSSLKVLSQAHRTYIITQSSKSIVLVDQHAAHERILFEKLLASLKDDQVDTQKHLIPLKIELDDAELEVVQKMKKQFESLGIQIKIQDSFCEIWTSPSWIKEEAIQKAIQQLTHDNIHSGASFTIEKVVSNICASLACHSAIRAGKTLSILEMENLLEQMDQFTFSSFCPHGRPVFVEYSLNRIEKEFGRIC